MRPRTTRTARPSREREFFVDNLLVRIHFIIVRIRWTGLAPWDFESPSPKQVRLRTTRTARPSTTSIKQRLAGGGGAGPGGRNCLNRRRYPLGLARSCRTGVRRKGPLIPTTKAGAPADHANGATLYNLHATGTPTARIPNPETRNPNPESRIPKPESRIPNPESRIPNPESRIPKPETRNPKPETRNPKPESRIPNPESLE